MKKMKFSMSDKTYDVLRWIAQIVLPALGVFWATIAEVWHFGYITEVLTTITAVDTCLGVILGISTAQYTADKESK